MLFVRFCVGRGSWNSPDTWNSADTVVELELGQTVGGSLTGAALAFLRFMLHIENATSTRYYCRDQALLDRTAEQA